MKRHTHEFNHGSDIEIADAVLFDLKEHFGEIIHSEGFFWRFNSRFWEALPEETLFRAIYQYDGVPWGVKGIVKLSKSKSESILHTMRMRAYDPTFFHSPAVGINCVSGFIRFDGAEAAVEPHDASHRQRHVLPGAYEPNNDFASGSLLEKFLHRPRL